MAQKITLTRMNGLGNDFLIYDNYANYANNFTFSKQSILHLSSRDNSETKGCDQFIIINQPQQAGSDAFMEIYNTDGSQVFACGNATRCIASLLFTKLNKNIVNITTHSDRLIAHKISDVIVMVDMSKPDFNWQQIPLAKEVDTQNLPILVQGLGVQPMAVSIGNPHMVFFIDKNIAELNLQELGPPLESNPLYPQKGNVSFANIVDNGNINLRVFERGVGETKACGTGACATMVCAVKKGLVGDSKVNIHMTGGSLQIEWDGGEKSHILMTGQVEYESKITAHVFEG